MLNYATLLSFTIISFAFATTPTTFDSICVSNDIANLDWRSYDNQVKLNDQRFNIKGVSWFGFETLNPPLSGLGVHNLDWYLQWIVDNDFNALRLPFSIEYILNNTVNQNTYRNVVHQAGLHGILVMVSMSSDASGGTEGFYEISHSNAIMCWEQITDLLKGEWNVFMVDVYSEPHDVTNEYVMLEIYIFDCY